MQEITRIFILRFNKYPRNPRNFLSSKLISPTVYSTLILVVTTHNALYDSLDKSEHFAFSPIFLSEILFSNLLPYVAMYGQYLLTVMQHHVQYTSMHIPVADPGFRKGRFHSNTNAQPGLTCIITVHSNFHNASYN